MKTGVYLEKAPKNWQILQQENGYADIELAGTYFVEDCFKEFVICDGLGAEVFAKVIEENTGRIVRDWVPCLVEENRWSVTLSVPAGGLYRIETCLLNRVRGQMEFNFRGDMRFHIGVGDVYVIAGQSNSTGYGKDSVYDPPEMGIHLLRNNGLWDIAVHPLNEDTDTLHEINAEFYNPGHSPYLAFARRLMHTLHYPIGLIATSLAGTSLEQWSPELPDDLYENMIETVRSQGKVKGILWYQGCNDTIEEYYQTYCERFEKLVNASRKALNQPELPWITAQLNRVTGFWADDIDNKFWGVVREQQRQAAHRIPGVSIIPTTDSGLTDEIHNRCSGNLMIGERMAEAALYDIYGLKDRLAKAPEVKSARYHAKDNQVELIFEYVNDRLYIFNAGMPFHVEDENGKNEITSFEIKNNRILLTLSRPLAGEACIHGEWEKNPVYPPVMDAVTHLPILSFYGVKIEK